MTDGATVDMLLEGKEGPKMMDNMTVADRGEVLLQRTRAVRTTSPASGGTTCGPGRSPPWRCTTIAMRIAGGLAYGDDAGDDD